jgi:hypothetical protein
MCAVRVPPVLEVNTTMRQKTVFLFETIADSSTAVAELEWYWLDESCEVQRRLWLALDLTVEAVSLHPG